MLVASKGLAAPVALDVCIVTVVALVAGYLFAASVAVYVSIVAVVALVARNLGAASVAVHVTVTFINVNYDSFFFALVTYLVALVVILMR